MSNYHETYLTGQALTAYERDCEASHDEALSQSDWRMDVNGNEYLTESDLPTDEDLTDWSEHYAWQAYETFTEYSLG